MWHVKLSYHLEQLDKKAFEVTSGLLTNDSRFGYEEENSTTGGLRITSTCTTLGSIASFSSCKNSNHKMGQSTQKQNSLLISEDQSYCSKEFHNELELESGVKRPD